MSNRLVHWAVEFVVLLNPTPQSEQVPVRSKYLHSVYAGAMAEKEALRLSSVANSMAP